MVTSNHDKSISFVFTIKVSLVRPQLNRKFHLLYPQDVVLSVLGHMRVLNHQENISIVFAIEKIYGFKMYQTSWTQHQVLFAVRHQDTVLGVLGHPGDSESGNPPWENSSRSLPPPASRFSSFNTSAFLGLKFVLLIWPSTKKFDWTEWQKN